ncbi:class I SAM-dependent methyltransferase [Flaviaesturariibacter flavus]|uniref:Class I SAM-dependent methyltransferase n=1 Tax=Flaviaesturariibacter flavus TaxID=2502780 RepID=A0A4R1B844_9BACT|nr:class I SAM-dependent methyltransferase [Flaviaesturariibacter flavus]TCJ12029.1 class I SAM-dependent methyltransferase [Flaviaesturariibacter flavus]
MAGTAEREWYRDWFNSDYYHKLYFERDEREAEAFLERLIGHLQPAPGATALDVACGKGRHSRFLAARGFDVTGIDISAESIAYARQFENEHLNFAVHDMRLPYRVRYFDYAFNFFTSFGYFATRREHDAALRTMAHSIRPRGTLLIDYLNVHWVEERLVHNEKKTVGDTQYEIHRWHDEHYFYKKIIVTDPAMDRPLVHTEKVAKFSLGDFTEMLAFQGMQIQEVFGDYSLGHYDVRRCPRLIVLARPV